MIVAETPDAYRFVTQPDHARLAGQLAAGWGNRRFAAAEPRSATVAAAHVHDDGWTAYDRRPHLDDDGNPVDFTALPAETWIDLYVAGIEAAVDLDPYAGLLVSMHGAGLRRGRYGLSPDWPASPEPFATFVDREEARQRELATRLEAAGDRIDPADVALLEALHDDGTPPAGAEGRLWTNYALLQAWDGLSLACCRSVDPPAANRLDDVPTGRDGASTTIDLRRLDPGVLGLDPYPFSTAPYTCHVPSRTVAKDAFDDEAGPTAAFYAARYEVGSLEFQRVD